MTIKNPIRFAALFASLFVFTGLAAAQGPVSGTDHTSANLTMNATVATALQLNISTGDGGAVVSGDPAGGLFAVSLGTTVNGLGTGTPDTGVTVLADATGALYSTPINLTPVYSGFDTELADISVEQGSGDDQDLAREGGTTITAASTVSVGPTAAITGAVSGLPNERHVGLYIPRTQVAGAVNAVLVYTVTMSLD